MHIREPYLQDVGPKLLLKEIIHSVVRKQLILSGCHVAADDRAFGRLPPARRHVWATGTAVSPAVALY